MSAITKYAKPEQWDAIQSRVLQYYAGGEFARCLSMNEADQAGDSLLVFLLKELSEAEDCASLGETKRRIQVAIDELQGLLDALDKGINP